MPTSRPPGARRGALRRRAQPPVDRVDRVDTTPLDVPRPATRPRPAVPPPSDAPPSPPRRPTVTRVAAARTRELTGATVGRVRTAGRADGAAESGLTQLLWVNAVHAAGDAMVAVALAGTLFFAAPTDAQRGNVALYLLVTMAPFALLAPVVGPLLDRLQRGRRWALAVSQLGRAALAVVVAAHVGDLWLYPAALGVLVLSKAHTVLRAAVVPRVLPAAMSLTSANARTSVFGLVTAAGAGAVGAGLAWALGPPWLLGATAAVFGCGAVLAVRLPRCVDVPGGQLSAGVLGAVPHPAAPGRRRPPAGPRVAVALRANAALRALGGFLTIFSAFLVQATVEGGWRAGLALGALAAAAGTGSVVGTAVGSRLHRADPDRLVLWSAAGAAAVTVAAAAFYSFAMAVLVAGVAAVANALGKVALDAIVQREVPERLRASAFARSETLLQLTWVVGGALGIALPPIGWLGSTVAAALLVLAVGLALWRPRQTAPTAPLPVPGAATDPLGGLPAQRWTG
ncbi:MFS transporter [Geodermatophilus sp. TF02-6]|uniref:MFS transporter n=1 Tax=Geodermatophilus sp. TF02-6 TaxID=2250575 RepID=UPI000DEBF089|nr:MFS transporter [Geodermatophilus sp. TF02-6]RBY75254.1 MFS transporter [Geodermatophilus sp. TF02-6]